jgi:uridylate kinase
VVREFHQTQQTDARSATGANVAGGISISLGEVAHRRSGNAEVEYEEFVMFLIKGGGSLERARAELDNRRKQLGLSIRVAREIECACMGIDATLPPIETPSQPADAEIYAQAGQIERQGDVGGALRTVLEALRNRVQSDLLLAYASHLELRLRLNEQALSHALEAVKINPGVDWYYACVMCAAHELGRKPLARQYAEKVVAFGQGQGNPANFSYAQQILES